MTQPVPDGYHTVTPYLTVANASEAIEFYKRAFGAEETVRMNGPDGSVGHAELQIGDSKVMLSDPFPQSSVQPPTTVGATTASVFLYLDDVDAAFQRAVDAGAKVEMALEDMFWGDRFGTVTDPFGHVWSMASHVEDVSPEEIEERAKAAVAAMAN
jgi:PhnB protein